MEVQADLSLVGHTGLIVGYVVRRLKLVLSWAICNTAHVNHVLAKTYTYYFNEPCHLK